MEGLIEGVTGWAIGDEKRQHEDGSSGLRDAASLYEKLERVIIPIFRNDRDRFVEIMKHAIDYRQPSESQVCVSSFSGPHCLRIVF